MTIGSEQAMACGGRATDRALLERFVRHREEEAFAALVKRHGSTVLAVTRGLLGDSAEADDAFQATFLVLARKAEGGRWQDSVRPWLRAVAHRLSLHARAGQRRLRGRELSVAALPLSGEGEFDSEDGGADPLREVTRRELRRLLEEELGELPEKYRAPVVLCYLEGKTNQEAARQLGWATGSISRRLARARSMLRERPRLRNLAITAGILGMLLTFALISLGEKESGSDSDTVAQVMCQFKGNGQHDPGIEEILASLQSPEPVNRNQVQSLALQTARRLESIRDQKPGSWRQQADAASQAARELALAAESDNPRSIALAGRKLHLACADCHTQYRSW